MKKLINSLNPEQQKELVALLRRNPSLNQSTAGIIEDHLSGNSADYQEAFGESNDIAKQTVSPAIAAFIAKDRSEKDVLTK